MAGSGFKPRYVWTKRPNSTTRHPVDSYSWVTSSPPIFHHSPMPVTSPFRSWFCGSFLRSPYASGGEHVAQQALCVTESSKGFTHTALCPSPVCCVQSPSVGPVLPAQSPSFLAHPTHSTALTSLTWTMSCHLACLTCPIYILVCGLGHVQLPVSPAAPHSRHLYLLDTLLFMRMLLSLSGLSACLPQMSAPALCLSSALVTCLPALPSCSPAPNSL